MKTIVQRARRYAALTPGERAVLRLIEGLACAALVAMLPIVADALGRTAVDWGNVARAALAAAAVAVLMALSKYYKAHGDPLLSDATATAGATLARRASAEAAPRAQGGGIASEGMAPGTAAE